MLQLIDGKLGVSDGKLVIGDECCCGGVPCPPDDADPLTISITFSGIGSCCVDTTTRSFSVTNPGDLNVTWELPRIDLHEWEHDEPLHR